MAAFCAWAPGAAFAEGDPLASGKTALVLRGAQKKSLRQNEVKIWATGSARVRGRALKMPVEGGELDPTTGLGAVRHRGGIAFRHHGRAVSFGNLVLDTATRTVTAKIDGKAMVFALARGVSFVRDGLGTEITVNRLLLSGSAAKRLNSRLRLKGTIENPGPSWPPIGKLGRVRIADLKGSASVLGPAEGSASGTGMVRPSANGSGNMFLGQTEAAILNDMFPGPPVADFVAGDLFGRFPSHAGIR